MFKTIALAISALIAVLLLYAATLPDLFRVERSTVIAAPPAKIQAAISDLHDWTAWSPYEKLDPDMKRTYSGATSGRGAVYAWDGNNKAGAGRIEITAAEPTRIAMTLDFIKPFAAHNAVEFTLLPEGDRTRVTWAMSGPVPYPAKIMHVFFDVDRMVGGDFETGLANLKSLTER